MPSTLSYPTVTNEEIDNLISFFNIMYNEEYPYKYKVAELFQNKDGIQPQKIYYLNNITMECENDILIASDQDEVLWNEQNNLHAILTDDIMYVTFHNFMDAITLTVGDNKTYGGIIRIFY